MKNTHPKLKAHASYAGILLAGIGFLANVAGIAGLVLDHANDLVVFAAVLTIICGLYLLLRRWGRNIDAWVILCVSLIVAGSVVLTLALKDRDAKSQRTGQDTSQSTTETKDTPSDTSTSNVPDTSGGHTVVFRTSLKLLSQEGLDIDDKKATILEQQSTASSPSDIYLSDYPALAVTTDKFYKYQAPRQSTGSTDKDQYNSCQNLIAHSQLGDKLIVPFGLKPGQQYCLTTTSGKLALMTLQELNDSGKDSTQYNANISIKVWN